MIPPHDWTPEEHLLFTRLRAAKFELFPGMHVLDTLYPHPNEPGGHAGDHIVISLTADKTGGHFMSSDGRSHSGSAADYYVPNLQHMETFINCCAQLKGRGLAWPEDETAFYNWHVDTWRHHAVLVLLDLAALEEE